jgi:hypothetical protein
MEPATGIRIIQISMGPGLPCPNPDCIRPLGTVSDVAPVFFQRGSVQCGYCKREVDVWEACRNLVRNNAGSCNGLTFFGAQYTTFTTKLARNELKEIDFSQHGIPADAVLLQASFHPQSRDCCNPLFSPGRYLPQMLTRKVLLFGQPLEGNAQEEVIAVAVTWVPFHDDFKESRIYFTEAFDVWASQKHWSVILPAYVAFEIALIRVVKSAMERRLSNERVADFLRDGLTSSVALNVILPLLCDASNVKHLPAPIRGELNRLRKLRNELVHDGLAKDAVSKPLASEMLCAAVFGFEYLRYAEGVLNVDTDRINPS